MVSVRAERQASKALLLIGLVLIVLAGYSPGSVPYNYIWKFIAGAVGIFLIAVAAGDVVASDQMDSRAANLHLLGFALIGLGSVLLLLMYAQLALNDRVTDWWVFPVVGAAFLLCGVSLILWARHQTPLGCLCRGGRED